MMAKGELRWQLANDLEPLLTTGVHCDLTSYLSLTRSSSQYQCMT